MRIAAFALASDRHGSCLRYDPFADTTVYSFSRV